MSDAQHSDHAAHHDAHGSGHSSTSSVGRTLASFVVPVVVIVILVAFSGLGSKSGGGSGGMSAEAVANRIQPIGSITVKDSSVAAAPKTGEQVYTAQCSACHATGAAGAPKLGDEAAWGPRVKTGFEALLNSAMKGKGAMTPQGTGDFSPLEIARAVVFMANKGGAKFEEPKAPAAAASGAADAASGAAGAASGATK